MVHLPEDRCANIPQWSFDDFIASPLDRINIDKIVCSEMYLGFVAGVEKLIRFKINSMNFAQLMIEKSVNQENPFKV